MDITARQRNKGKHKVCHSWEKTVLIGQSGLLLSGGCCERKGCQTYFFVFLVFAQVGGGGRRLLHWKRPGFERSGATGPEHDRDLGTEKVIGLATGMKTNAERRKEAAMEPLAAAGRPQKGPKLKTPSSGHCVQSTGGYLRRCYEENVQKQNGG